jgi:hypothetical protein
MFVFFVVIDGIDYNHCLIFLFIIIKNTFLWLLLVSKYESWTVVTVIAWWLGGGSWSTRRKPTTFHKPMTNFVRAGIEHETFVMIGTDYIGIDRYNHHAITVTTVQDLYLATSNNHIKKKTSTTTPLPTKLTANTYHFWYDKEKFADTRHKLHYSE